MNLPRFANTYVPFEITDAHMLILCSLSLRYRSPLKSQQARRYDGVSALVHSENCADLCRLRDNWRGVQEQFVESKHESTSSPGYCLPSSRDGLHRTNRNTTNAGHPCRNFSRPDRRAIRRQPKEDG